MRSTTTRTSSSESPAGTSTAAATEVQKLLSGAFAAGVAVLGALGATTGGVARLQRNGGAWIVFTLVCLVVACAAGLAGAWTSDGPRRWVLVTGGMALLLALASASWTSWSLAQQRDRPRVSATWKSTEDPLVLAVAAKATGVGVDDRLTVLVRAPQVSATFFFGQTGPDSDGVAEQSADVFIPRDARYDVIEVSAYVGDVYATCDGVAYSRGAIERGDAATALPDGVRPACLSIKSIPAPASTGPAG